jgi:hypothetical protein
MATKDELHALVERLQPAALDDVAILLRQYAEQAEELPYPQSLGMGHSRHSDSFERVDEILREIGFGD